MRKSWEESHERMECCAFSIIIIIIIIGFTGVGYPKVLPVALADHVEKNNLQVCLNKLLSINNINNT